MSGELIVTSIVVALRAGWSCEARRLASADVEVWYSRIGDGHQRMSDLDEQVFSIIKKYMDRKEPIGDEGIQIELSSVDIKASLQRLQVGGRIIGVPLNLTIPDTEED